MFDSVSNSPKKEVTMKFEDLPCVYTALLYNNPEKRAFVENLKALTPGQAKAVLSKKLYRPYDEHALFQEAKRYGISKTLILQVARWVLHEDYWNNHDIITYKNRGKNKVR